MPAGNGSIHQRPRRLAVGEEFALIHRILPRLIGHVLLAAGGGEAQKQKQCDRLLHSGTSITSTGLRPSRNARVPSRLNFGSFDLITRKNLSRLACWREIRNVEQRMMRLRKTVQSKHSKHCGESREQDDAFEGNRDKRRPTVVGAAADVDRVGDDVE
jgi:hypothetical protein